MKNFLKRLPVIFAALTLCLCSMLFAGFRCGPDPLEVGLNNMRLITDDGSAYICVVNYGTALGYFTDASGNRVQACYDLGYTSQITVRKVCAEISDDNIYFTLDAEYVYGEDEVLLNCTLAGEAKGVEISFTQLNFKGKAEEKDIAEPFSYTYANLISADGNMEIGSGVPDYAAARLCRLYYFDGDGYVTGITALWCWTSEGFFVYPLTQDNKADFSSLLLSGVYTVLPDLPEDEGAHRYMLTIQNDNLYGDLKPFASYPQIEIG